MEEPTKGGGGQRRWPGPGKRRKRRWRWRRRRACWRRLECPRTTNAAGTTGLPFTAYVPVVSLRLHLPRLRYFSFSPSNFTRTDKRTRFVRCFSRRSILNRSHRLLAYTLKEITVGPRLTYLIADLELSWWLFLSLYSVYNVYPLQPRNSLVISLEGDTFPRLTNTTSFWWFTFSGPESCILTIKLNLMRSRQS